VILTPNEITKKQRYLWQKIQTKIQNSKIQKLIVPLVALEQNSKIDVKTLTVEQQG